MSIIDDAPFERTVAARRAERALPVAGRQPAALAARRAFLVAAPVLAGLFAIVGAYADPAAGTSGQEMWKVYAANPEPLERSGP